jgi:hypothetical protein
LSDFDYDWPTPGMKIYKDYTIDDYKIDRKKLLDEKNIQIDGIIFVQVLATEKETGKLMIFYHATKTVFFFLIRKSY